VVSRFNGAEEDLETNLLVGTADSVAARLEELREEIGLKGLLAEFNCRGRIPHALSSRPWRLLCAQVQPRFR
jgi:alkanesulfonate monooxygenase SsuD/methylene tetrahydromethanopterin reductase-like flavin-dependent oxidoreductase (luciferase family)